MLLGLRFLILNFNVIAVNYKLYLYLIINNLMKLNIIRKRLFIP